jgi:hypothetical protein
MDRRTPLLAALLLSLGSLAAASDAARAADSLFSRLGGTTRVSALVDTTVEQLAAQPGDALSGNLDDVKADLVARICAVTGGGCRFKKSAHKSASLTAGAELVEALRVAMRTHGVPLAARNELLEALASTRRDVARL